MQKQPGNRAVPGLSWWPLALLVAVLAGPASGQRAGAVEEAGNEPAAEQAESSPEPPAEDVFIPTEEISEDFAVSFPVDI